MNSVDRSSDAMAANCDVTNLTERIGDALASLLGMDRAVALDDERRPKCRTPNVTMANSGLAGRIEVVTDCRMMLSSVLHRTDMLNTVNCTANDVT